MILTNFGMLAMIEVYSMCIPRIRESIFCPDIHTFNNWGEYFKLGVPATVMLCAEFWSFEILIFLSGVLGVNQQAAAVIFFQITVEMFSINSGIQEATAAVVGNQVGSLNVPLAKKYAWTAYANGILLSSLVSILVFAFRVQIIYLFTDD